LDDLGIAFAIVFHDAVYRPGERDNEARSAALLRDAVRHSAEADWANTAILATADHLAYAGTDRRVLRLLDLDLTPLAEKPAILAYNAAALRAEAGAMSDREWITGQRRFLGSMLARPLLFRSGLGGVYEAPARRNIEALCREGPPPP
jgi:predicted metal-dependent HD superfamily phosphohydrolase